MKKKLTAIVAVLMALPISLTDSASGMQPLLFSFSSPELPARILFFPRSNERYGVSLGLTLPYNGCVRRTAPLWI